jgi:sugar lactone lactonase YvrE
MAAVPERIAATVATDRAYGLAEGPLWDEPRERLLWVDINAGEVHVGRLGAGNAIDTVEVVVLGDIVAAVVAARDGRLAVARRRDVIVLGDEAGTRSLATLIDPNRDSRLNDGGCDPAGRLLIGSMALDGRERDERLWRLEPDGNVTVLDDDLTLSNGLGWSPDGGTLYSVDTTPGVIHARAYDARTGATGERREAVRITDGSPDGMTVDAEGNLWVAIFGAGEVRCLTPQGELLATIDVPAPHVTSVAFAGPSLDTLVITTAREELDPAALREHPLSGRLFCARPGVNGLPPTPWAGP